MAVAVVEDGLEEALGLARPRAGGHERRPRLLTAKPLESLFLMQPGPKTEGDVGEVIGAALSLEEGELHRKVRPLEDAALLVEQPSQHPVEKWAGDGKGGFEKIFYSLSDMLREDGGDHFLVLTFPYRRSNSAQTTS